MNALRIEKRLDSHILPELIPLVGKQVEVIVLEKGEAPARKAPKTGSAKGKVIMASDFDAPLEEFAEYMK
jgi:hypothetical protein